jgi:hypothetical protein
LRSGYAFSHSQGFGELITSGINMRQRAQEKGEESSVIIMFNHSFSLNKTCLS